MIGVRRFAVVVSLPLFASALSAQPAVGADPATCPYEACALRMSTRVFHGVGVQRGLNGPIEPFGFAGGGMVRAVAGVPAAVLEAEAGRRRTLRGGVTSIVGSLASISLGLLANRAANSATVRRNLWIGSGIGGAVAFYGGIDVTRGEEHFAKAVWLYNQALPKER